MGKSSGLDVSQNAIMASRNNGSVAQTAPKDRNHEILGKLLKHVRLIVMGEMDEEDPPSMVDVNEAVKAINAKKRAWNEMTQKTSSIEENMMAIEEIVKKRLAGPARKAALAVVSGAPPPRSYASVVAPQITNTTVRTRIDGT